MTTLCCTLSLHVALPIFLLVIFFYAPPTPVIYTLSLHDALPILVAHCAFPARCIIPLANLPWNTFNGKFARGIMQDRKSTRLNSSHTVISYAVFCLKKKIKDIKNATGIKPIPNSHPLYRVNKKRQ